MFLNFPNFNLYSSPLLLLIIQGLIFAVLLFRRYRKKGHLADLLLAVLLVITAYHRTSYTIGFMGWYDTFRNTKINYYLISLTVAVGPLIYFYVKSLVEPHFKFKPIHFWHFLPAFLNVIYCIVVYIHDVQQPGFYDTQNGEWYLWLNMEKLPPFFSGAEYTSRILYFAFTIQLFARYKQKIEQFFSNTYKVELNWIRNFLAVYIFLMLFGYLLDGIGLFVELRWIDNWWLHFFTAISLVYLGFKAYMTDLTKLYEIRFNFSSDQLVEESNEKDFSNEMRMVKQFFDAHQPYLNPEITLPQLAKELKMGTNELSQTINSGFGMNFNDFINQYRVEEIKSRITDPSNQHLSLLGIAYECGFNSKATFNRVFKKFTQISPSEYLKSQKGEAS
jgi:AraC-like DNA-binding protein